MRHVECIFAEMPKGTGAYIEYMECAFNLEAIQINKNCAMNAVKTKPQLGDPVNPLIALSVEL